jgi:arylsulfatase A-like enzyme
VRATEKIAEHGGGHSDDLAVPLVVSGASVPDGVRDSASVQTKQIAPTILSLLGLDPRSLQAVREEHTTALPVR